LEERDVDPAAAAQRGQYVVLDAAETLAKFMIDGWPDGQRFVDVVGGELARLASRYGRVRAFGEMVALLWAAHNPEATVRLDQLWNNLSKCYPFYLLCAYPLEGFIKPAAGSQFRSVCSEHTRVVPLHPAFFNH
jgi:hypothetical protein